MPKIIFQNEDYIVIDKPAGLTVHRGINIHPVKSSEAGAPPAQFNGASEKTLVDFLVGKFPEIASVGDDPKIRPGIVHRLDKETSGVMVIARNRKSFEYLKKLFKERKVKKEYLALVHGKMKSRSGKIEGEMGRSKRDFRKQALVRGKIGVRKERYSLTNYKVKKEFNEYALLEVFPATGRMHQIRVHLHSIGHPVIGDEKYTFKQYKKKKYTRLFLHAREISFLGKNGEKYVFRADVPRDFAVFLGDID